MKFNKAARTLLIIGWAAIIFLLPRFFHVYYLSLYYIIMGLWVAITVLGELLRWPQLREEKFYLRWAKRRQVPAPRRIVREGLRSLGYLFLVMSLQLLFAHGYTWADVVNKLTGKQLVLIALVFLVLCSVLTPLSVYEKERRYFRLWERKNDQG